jgi:hypothetical protein
MIWNHFDSLLEVTIKRIRSDRINFTFWKKMDRVESIYMLWFFRSLIIFDWNVSHLISGQIKFELNQVYLTFLKNRIELYSDPKESDDFIGSN